MLGVLPTCLQPHGRPEASNQACLTAGPGPALPLVTPRLPCVPCSRLGNLDLNADGAAAGGAEQRPAAHHEEDKDDAARLTGQHV